MLILSHRKGQSILIGDDIEVIITEVHRSSVKIAVRAPKHLTVMRAEIAADHASDIVGSDALEDPVD
jgi:carbon storage regulator